MSNWFDNLNEEVMDAIVQISSEAVWVKDIENDQSFWLASKENKEKYQLPLFNTNPDFWIDNLHQLDKERATLGFQRALHNPVVDAFEHEYRFNGSTEYYIINDKMRFLRDSTGVATRIVGVWTDITEKRYREEKLNDLFLKLEAERDQFQIISNLTNAATWQFDVGKRCLYWSAGRDTLDNFGLTKPYYTLDDWKETIHPEDRLRVIDHFETVLRSKEVKCRDRFRVTKPDGTVAYIVSQGYVVRDETGRAIQMIGGWIDTTAEFERQAELQLLLDEQKLLNEKLSLHEKELAVSEEKLKLINEKLTSNLSTLTEQEFLLRQSQKLASIGSWEYDLNKGEYIWSKELYSIMGVDEDFTINDVYEVARLFEGEDNHAVTAIMRKTQHLEGLPFDTVLAIRIPIGYKKWVRVTGQVFQSENKTRVIGLVYDVTRFKESENRLRVSEEKFAKVFNNNPDLMTVSNDQTHIVLNVNEKIEHVLGFKKNEVIGKTTVELGLYLQTEDRKKYLEEYTANGSASMECTWKKKDGTPIEVMLNSVRLDLDGRNYILTVIKDITARKAAEERFTKGFNLSPDLMLIFRERDKVLVEANSKLESFSYYRRSDVIGKSAEDFRLWINPDERATHLLEYQSMGHAFQEALLRKNGGEVFYGAISSTQIPLSGEDHMLVVVRDVTDRKLAEEQLQLSEANLLSTINNTSLMVWSVDRNYKLLTANEPFKKFIRGTFGLEVILGKSIIPLDIGDPGLMELSERWVINYNKALEGTTFKLLTKRGDRFFDYSLSPIIERGSTTGVSVFAEDVTERTLQQRELGEAYRQIGEFRLMALRSVMNPHFIFNALNSIQYFIVKNDRKNAVNYLSTFSKLIRGILTHSVKNQVSLADEIEMLRHYVDLEQLRFENKFDFELMIDPHLEIESIEVPSLLIQPYVENAILHGLYNKQGRGKLKIDLQEDLNGILVMITDDGIGREAATQLKKQNFPNHKSMGSILTEERLKLINRGESVHLEILDLYDDAGRGRGTCVKIRVTIDYN